MAENIGALILPIGADASQFNRSINDVKAAIKTLADTIASTPFNLVTDAQKLQYNALIETLKELEGGVKNFGKAIEEYPANSILGLKERIRQLNDEKIRLDPTTSASKIAQLTQETDKLEDKLKNVNNLGRSVGDVGGAFSKGADKIVDSSKGAGRALTSLSLVAQDLPFGFIGIQNNLPALIQTFGELQRTSGSVKGALVQLVSSISGPSGLFFAFSAATAEIGRANV
jgi:methyl-accepting chemotaxis protein